MAKPRGAICNLNCRYCYFLKKDSLYQGSNFRMSDEVLEAYTSQLIEAQQVPEVTFAWQGGEPTLMGLEFFQRAIFYQGKYQRPNMRVLNAIQTNGINLDDAWGRFFKKHDFLVGISIDGPSHMHDTYRVGKDGKPTHARVMDGLKFLKEHQVDFNVLTTVNAANEDHPLEVYRFLREKVEARFIQFIPIVERDNDTGFQEGRQVTNRSVKAKQYGRFLTEIFDEWVRRDVGEIFVQIFDVALGAWTGRPGSLCVFAPTCGVALAIEHNGDLYTCDHYVEPRYHLGNILHTHMAKLAASKKQLRFGMDKHDRLPGFCRRCEVRFACQGGCPKNRLISTPDGKRGLNYLCDGYKMFFTHIEEPMKIMATLLHQGRPPAEIMHILPTQGGKDERYNHL